MGYPPLLGSILSLRDSKIVSYHQLISFCLYEDIGHVHKEENDWPDTNEEVDGPGYKARSDTKEEGCNRKFQTHLMDPMDDE